MCNLPNELPCDRDLERHVICETMFESEECIPIIEKAGGENLFHISAWRYIYRAAAELFTEGVEVDQMTVTDRVAKMDKMETIGGELTIVSVVSDPCSGANIAAHCKLLAEFEIRRRLVLNCRYTLARASDRAEAIGDTLDDIGSALKEIHAILGEGGRSLADDVRDWVLSTDGVFMSTDVYSDLGLSTRVNKRNCSVILRRLVEEGLIERWGNRRGSFRKVNTECERIDLTAERPSPLTLSWPLGLEHHVELMPGNVAVVAGEPNAGKTAFMLDFVRRNMACYEIHYFSSEMGAAEMQKRLDRFGMPMKEWTFNAWERVSDFEDILRPDAVNVIDYLEAYEDFFKLGGEIAKIHRRLKRGIALVAIQKNRNTDIGRGGSITLEKPRLYLALSQGECSIVKAKNWAGNHNPNGLTTRFTLKGGTEFVHGDWCAAR